MVATVEKEWEEMTSEERTEQIRCHRERDRKAAEQRKRYESFTGCLNLAGSITNIEKCIEILKGQCPDNPSMRIEAGRRIAIFERQRERFIDEFMGRAHSAHQELRDYEQAERKRKQSYK